MTEGKRFRVKFMALQRTFSHCITIKMVKQRVLSTLTQNFTSSVSVTLCVKEGTADVNTPLGICDISLLLVLAL